MDVCIYVYHSVSMLSVTLSLSVFTVLWHRHLGLVTPVTTVSTLLDTGTWYFALRTNPGFNAFFLTLKKYGFLHLKSSLLDIWTTPSGNVQKHLGHSGVFRLGNVKFTPTFMNVSAAQSIMPPATRPRVLGDGVSTIAITTPGHGGPHLTGL